jgi:hypothetical protein
MKILDFFLILWVIFALLDPDPDPATQINADPDPKPWSEPKRIEYKEATLGFGRRRLLNFEVF